MPDKFFNIPNMVGNPASIAGVNLMAWWTRQKLRFTKYSRLTITDFRFRAAQSEYA
jgi:hypothetical protein